MDDLKKKIVAAMACASGIREQDRIKLVTQAGVIDGKVVREFGENLSDNGKINARILDKVVDASGDDSSMLDFVFLSDVTVLNGNTKFSIENLIVFTDEIIGVCL